VPPDAPPLVGVLLVAVSYLVGAIPFGLVVARMSGGGVDPRKSGSGNIGATNVARTLGKGAGALTLFLDAGKAVFALFLTSLVMGPASHGWLAFSGGAAFLGHVFPVYLRFKGGKGVATALGIVAFLSPVTVVVLLALFAAVVYFTRYVSLGSLCAAVGLPVMMAVLEGPRSYLNLSLLFAFVVFFTHRENIHRLLAGQEPRFELSRKA
jgi:glycerol-3-phosphate acyltransferase PlsY